VRYSIVICNDKSKKIGIVFKEKIIKLYIFEQNQTVLYALHKSLLFYSLKRKKNIIVIIKVIWKNLMYNIFEINVQNGHWTLLNLLIFHICYCTWCVLLCTILGPAYFSPQGSYCTHYLLPSSLLANLRLDCSLQNVDAYLTV